MPDPIQSIDPSVCSLPEDVTTEENAAQMCLASAHPLANTAPSAAPTPNAPPAPSPAPSPAVNALVSRFTAPSGAHPPVEPSLGKALLNCKTPIANYLISLGAIAVSAPETAGASLLASGRVLNAAVSVQNCLDDKETQQVADGNRANQAADCQGMGAIPLVTANGSIVCAK